MDELDTLSAAALAPDVKDIAGAPGSEALDRDVRTTPREMTLARFVYGVFQANEQYAVRQGYHDQMRERRSASPTTFRSRWWSFARTSYSRR